jgi:hypothetical protein
MSIESDISQAAEDKGQDDLCTTRYLDRARLVPRAVPTLFAGGV